MQQPAPFHLVNTPPSALRVATNGQIRLTVLEPDGKLFLRRGLTGVMAAPTAQTIIPQLNQLAGELLQHSDMPAEDVAARLHALQMFCKPHETQKIEWACASLNGVNVFTDGVDIIVTTQDLRVTK